MRRIVLALPLLFVTVCLVAVTAQTGAPAKPMAADSVKIDSAWKCTAPNPMNAIPIGDEPGHAYVIQQAKCTATKGEIAGVKEVDGTATDFLDAWPTGGKGHGIFVENMANGDKIIVTYDATGTMANNMFQSGTDKWTVKSGTGKFKGAKGTGSCTAKGNPDGSANFTCTGTYTLAAAK